MSGPSKLFKGVTTLDKSAFSFSTGLRSAIFVMLPLIVGFLTSFPGAVFVGLGAVFLNNTEGPSSILPSRILLVACFTEALAWGLGTLAGTAGLLAPALIGIGVFVPALVRTDPKWAQLATFTAISFAVGAGLPGGSLSAAWQRTYLSLLGALFALTGVVLHRLIDSRKKSPDKTDRVSTTPVNPATPRSDVVLNAAALGIASAFGFGIALALGLPRDFWVVVTIIITIRPTLNLTLTFTSLMVLGTLVGASVGAAVVLEISNLYVLLTLLFVFSLLMYATRGVNLGLAQVFFAPFVIVLLNIIYPAGLEYAEARIFDVALGGVISVATVYLVGLRSRVRWHFG